MNFNFPTNFVFRTLLLIHVKRFIGTHKQLWGGLKCARYDYEAKLKLINYPQMVTKILFEMTIDSLPHFDHIKPTLKRHSPPPLTAVALNTIIITMMPCKKHHLCLTPWPGFNNHKVLWPNSSKYENNIKTKHSHTNIIIPKEDAWF